MVAVFLGAGGYKGRLRGWYILISEGERRQWESNSQQLLSNYFMPGSGLSCVYHLGEVHTSCVINIPTSYIRKLKLREVT